MLDYARRAYYTGSMIELRLLKYFLAVANEGSITRAAEVVHTSQPNLSRQMQELEDVLGCRLFERGKTVSLTDSGELLRRRATEILSLAAKTEAELSSDELTGTLSVGFGEMKCVQDIARLAVEFRRTHPNVSFEFFTGTADQVKEQMEKGILDMGLLLEPVEIEKYCFFRLPERLRCVAVMQDGCLLAQKTAVTPDDLVPYPLILPTRANVRNEITAWFARRFKDLHVVAVHNLSANTAALVAHGLGIALCTEGISVPEGTEKLLAVRPLDPDLSHTVVLAWKKSLAHSHLLEAFIRFAKEFFIDGGGID